MEFVCEMKGVILKLIRNKRFWILIAFGFLIGIGSCQQKKIARQKEQIILLESNQEALLSGFSEYKTKTGEQAATIQELQLTLSEYKRYRSEDLKLIESLKVDKKGLQKIVTAQSETIRQLELSVKDSVIIREPEPGIIIRDTLKCVEFHDEWMDFDGCSDGDVFSAKIASRSDLYIVEHVKRKRFLFIRYGIKSRSVDIIDRNPYTDIASLEFITIIK